MSLTWLAQISLVCLLVWESVCHPPIFFHERKTRWSSNLAKLIRMEGLWENVTFKENNILILSIWWDNEEPQPIKNAQFFRWPLKHFFGEIGKMTGHGLARDCGNGLPDRAGTRFWKWGFHHLESFLEDSEYIIADEGTPHFGMTRNTPFTFFCWR